MSRKIWPPPGSPLVEGRLAITTDWSIHLPERFARRVEDGSLVLWRPGLTIWLAAWGNDHHESGRNPLDWVKETASLQRYAEEEHEANGITYYQYRLRDESADGTVESIYAYIFGGGGLLQLAVYLDDPGGEDEARRIVDSVERL